MHNENWDDLRYVLAVAEGGSVSAAARTLGVNHATVLRRIAAFEERHGGTLFEKDARGYSVPPDRLRVIEAAREVFAAMGAVERLMEGGRPKGQTTVRVTTTDTFAQSILPGILARLSDSDPGLRFEVLTTNNHLNFARLHADITVRPAIALPDDMVGEPVARMALAIYARPGMETGPWLGPSGALARIPATQWLLDRIGAEEVAGGADSFPTLQRLASEGLGRVMLPCILGDTAKGLVRIEEVDEDLSVPLWVACHVDLAESPRIARLRRAIGEGVAAAIDALAGRQ